MSKFFDTRENCPACNSGEQEIIYSSGYQKEHIKKYLHDFYDKQGGVEFEYLDGANFILAECKNCQLIFQKEIPNDFLMERLYEKWINPEKVFQRYESNYPLNYYYSNAHLVYKVIAYFNVKPKDLKIFDFGMGWGNWSLMAKAFGCDSFGTELSSARIEHAKSCGIKVISWLEIADHTFDFINTDQVFEHIPKPLETLKYLSGSLKKGGLIRISVPNGRGIKKRLKKTDWTADKGSKNSLNAVAPLEHINCFNNTSLKKMADGAGLEIVRIPFYPRIMIVRKWTGLLKEITRVIKNQLHFLSKQDSKRTDLYFKKTDA
jgi:2-polyprenyl-3-methyl-5-hydroxy-6-metoxy-1,4-benzoquinol methylase